MRVRMLTGWAVLVAVGGLGCDSAPPVPPVPPAPPPAVSVPAEPLLDGYRIDHVPAGLTRDERDSTGAYAVSENHLHNDDVPPPDGSPTASVAMRMYLRANGGHELSVSVLRPETTTPGADARQVVRWLTAWAIGGQPVQRSFDVPAGSAQLTGDQILITTPDHVLITVSGSAGVTGPDLERVATSIRRA